MTIKPTSDAVAVTGAEEAEREARRRRRFHESLHPARPMTEDVAGLVDDFTSALRLGVEDDVTIPFDLAVRIHAALVAVLRSALAADAALTTPAPAVSTDEIVAMLERCSEIVDHNLHRQREKVEDVPRMLRQLASRIRGEGE